MSLIVENHNPMERVLFKIHHQVCNFTLRHTSSRTRILFEQFLLVLSICGFSALLISHIAFVYRPDVMLIDSPTSSSRTTTTPVPSNPNTRSLRNNIPLTCLSSIPGFQRDVDITYVLLIDENEQSYSYSTSSSRGASLENDACEIEEHPMKKQKHQRRMWEEKNASNVQCEAQRKQLPNQQDQNVTTIMSNLLEAANLNNDKTLYVYSKVKGYIYLPPSYCMEHNIKAQVVAVSKSDVQCFGEPFLQRIVFHVLAPDVVMINWILAIDGVKGYIYNPFHDITIDLNKLHHNHFPTTTFKSSTSSFSANSFPFYTLLKTTIGAKITSTTNKSRTIHNKTNNGNTGTKDRNKISIANSDDTPRKRSKSYWFYHILGSKLSILIKTSFLFFITTTLISFTLRETQDRMLEFTIQLKTHVRSGQPLTQLVISHIIENLVFIPIMVGMTFFLIEFYHGDWFLAFLVLSIVWVGEAFSVLSLRSYQGIRFYPRAFFFLFSLFHYYLFSFPFGFAYTAWGIMMFFMLHSFLFFWNRYELPAVVLGLVTEERPRLLQVVPNNITTIMMQSASLSVPVRAAGFVTGMGETNSPNHVTASTNTNGNTNGNFRTTSQSHYATSNNGNNSSQFPFVALSTRATGSSQRSSYRTYSSAGSIMGRMSRQTSSSGLIFNTSDGDDESSYVVFMDGEVVMHRDVRSHSPFTSPSSMNSLNTPSGDTSNLNADAAASSAQTNSIDESHSDHNYDIHDSSNNVEETTSPGGADDQLNWLRSNSSGSQCSPIPQGHEHMSVNIDNESTSNIPSTIPAIFTPPQIEHDTIIATQSSSTTTNNPEL